MELNLMIGNVINSCFYILSVIGYWLIFRKCGVRGWYALIPVAREYQLGRCADRERDGRTFAITYVICNLLEIIGSFLPKEKITTVMGVVYMVVLVVMVVMYLTQLIYSARVFSGLTQVFNRSRRWVLLMIVLEGPTLILWGLSPKFMPSKKVVDYGRAKAAGLSGVEAATAGEGLTVNIRERAVIDFFRKRYLLRDIHMTIPKGHMVLLLGGSGAGKTTYVNAVTGYEKAKAVITLDGHDVYREYEGMKYDIGFVPQQDLMRGNDTVHLTLTDAATLRLPASVSWADRRKRVKVVLEQFGLGGVRNHLVEKLSGGQRKRLSIAMEYISDPSLFILDEPDSGLDGVVARGLFEKLRAIADTGKIVLVITHTPDRVIDLFDDVIVLAKDAKRTGRLAWYGSVEETYTFFGKSSMEEILKSINQKEEGGEGRADEFVEKFNSLSQQKAG